MLAATNSYVDKIRAFAKEVNIEFTDYQKLCVVNAVRSINPMIESSGYSWQNFGIDNILTVLQQTAFLQLNPSAVPRECYFIVRKNYSKDQSGKRIETAPTLEFGIEGAGNDIILRKYGTDVKEVKSYIVYQGDEFTEGFMDGWEMTLPKYRRTFKTNKPEKAVYLIKKSNNEIDVQYADLEDVKKSLLANARQNGADDKILRELSKLGLYEILEDEKWLDYKISKSYSKQTYTTPLFNPSYTSPISMYNMIERKLRNHATRKYPKDFNANELSNLYEETFEEKYDNKGNLIMAEERVQIASGEFDDKAGTEIIEETTPNDDRPTIENVDEETGEVNVTESEETEQLIEPNIEENDDMPFSGNKKENVESKLIQEQPLETMDRGENKDDDDSDPDWDE
jgi:hypothetical protein